MMAIIRTNLRRTASEYASRPITVASNRGNETKRADDDTSPVPCPGTRCRLLGTSGATCAQNTAEPSFTLTLVGPNVWIDASTDVWLSTLATLAKSEPDSTFVSGHGDVGSARDVGVFRDYLATLRVLVSEARARGQSGDALADTVVPALAEKYGSWDGFKYLARPNILHRCGAQWQEENSTTGEVIPAFGRLLSR